MLFFGVKKNGELLSAGKLNAKQQEHYSGIMDELRKELDKFTHKDQNARWMGGGINHQTAEMSADGG